MVSHDGFVISFIHSFIYSTKNTYPLLHTRHRSRHWTFMAVNKTDKILALKEHILKRVAEHQQTSEKMSRSGSCSVVV